MNTDRFRSSVPNITVLGFKSTKVLEIQRLTISPFQVVDGQDRSPTSRMTLPDHYSDLVSDWLFSKMIVVEATKLSWNENTEASPLHLLVLAFGQ